MKVYFKNILPVLLSEFLIEFLEPVYLFDCFPIPLLNLLFLLLLFRLLFHLLAFLPILTRNRPASQILWNLLLLFFLHCFSFYCYFELLRMDQGKIMLLKFEILLFQYLQSFFHFFHSVKCLLFLLYFSVDLRTKRHDFLVKRWYLFL